MSDQVRLDDVEHSGLIILKIEADIATPAYRCLMEALYGRVTVALTAGFYLSSDLQFSVALTYSVAGVTFDGDKPNIAEFTLLRE